MLSNQIDILVYSGAFDLACNTAGSKSWLAKMPWKGQAPFTAQAMKPWKTIVDGKEVVAGTFKEVSVSMSKENTKKTKLAFVIIENAGHLVSFISPGIDT